MKTRLLSNEYEWNGSQACLPGYNVLSVPHKHPLIEMQLNLIRPTNEQPTIVFAEGFQI